MAGRIWTLTDVEQDIFVESFSLGSKDVGGPPQGSITKRTLRGGLREGVDVIEVDNGAFRFVLLPTRGMGLWRADCGELHLGWKSPVLGPVHPGFVQINEASGIGWLDGFDELMCRCGLENNGAPQFNPDGSVRYPLHGRIANRPAHRVQVEVDESSGEIRITGVVDEARLFGNKLRLTSVVTTRPGQAGLTIRDTVTNLSAESGELELLYHTNFGPPLAGPGSKVVVPVGKLAPRDAVAMENVPEWDLYGPATPGLGEAVFFLDLLADRDGQTRALLHNREASRGVSLSFNKNQLPCFTIWKNRQAIADGYVTGLEPSINYPNVRSFEKEQGRVAVLAGGESRSYSLSIEAHGDAASVAEAQQAVARLQALAPAQILPHPEPAWSPFRAG